jgi:hypothetical protein
MDSTSELEEKEMLLNFFWRFFLSGASTQSRSRCMAPDFEPKVLLEN